MVGSLQSSLGNFDASRDAYQSALKTYEELVRHDPEVANFRIMLGGTLNNLARLDLSAGRTIVARDRLLSAIEQQKKALKLSPGHPQSLEFLRNHYRTLITVAANMNEPDLVRQGRLELVELSAQDPQLAAADERLKAILSGQPAKDDAERLALAQRAYDTARFALSARLFREALEHDPSLAEPRENQIAYNATCAAALAGTETWLDDPAPTAAEQADYRALALHWLGAELDRWEKLAASKPNFFSQLIGGADPKIIPQTMQHWQQDPDLMGVRGAAIEKLPEAERGAWQGLWMRVDTLHKQSTPPPANEQPAEKPPQEVPEENPPAKPSS